MAKSIEKGFAVAVVGPTACGKTRRAVEIAQNFNGEIISADSRQIYRRMSIGTGKDIQEYGSVPYHMIDICEPGEHYNIYQYLKTFRESYKDILKRHRLPVICGGSGMYVENAIRGIRLPDVPENPGLRESLASLSLSELTNLLKTYKVLHNTTDVDTVKRAVRAIEICEYYKQHPEETQDAFYDSAKPLNCLVIGLEIDREERRKRITERLKSRLQDGMVDEIRDLLESGLNPEDLIYYGLEYKFVTLFVTGKLSYDDMFNQLEIAIHQFAKRQMTWFRGMEKRGVEINWVPYNAPFETIKNLIAPFINL